MSSWRPFRRKIFSKRLSALLTLIVLPLIVLPLNFTPKVCVCVCVSVSLSLSLSVSDVSFNANSPTQSRRAKPQKLSGEQARQPTAAAAAAAITNGSTFGLIAPISLCVSGTF